MFFYTATLISSKLWKFPVHSLIRRDFSFSAFPFIDQERFFLFLWLFQMKGAVVQHSYIIKKLQLALIKKPNPSHSESFNKVQIFQRCTNHSSSHKFCKEVKNHSTLYKSFNVVQIIQRCTTVNSTLCKSCNLAQIIQRSANHST